jgi:hypothetical protein
MAWRIIRDEEDRWADVRIVIELKKGFGSYMSFEGEPEEVIYLLGAALREANRRLSEGRYTDRRAFSPRKRRKLD